MKKQRRQYKKNTRAVDLKQSKKWGKEMRVMMAF